MESPVGVLLLTYGSANDPAGVREYLRSVHGGNDPDPRLLAEFERRYQLIGRSPLVDITNAQARALQQELDAESGRGQFVVRVGMLHSEPTIESAVEDLIGQGVCDAVAIVLAPQFSSLILSGYQRTLDRMVATHDGFRVQLAGAWHQEPEFIRSLAERLRATLDEFPPAERAHIPVIFTAHSLPEAVVKRDPGYITQLMDTAKTLARDVDLPRSRWQFAYQSAGHSPEPWLKPDLVDLLPGLRASGAQDVVIAPLQFCADHLEILYDLDIAAREQTEAHGLRYHRIAMPNTSPAFITALAAVVRRETSTLDVAAPARRA